MESKKINQLATELAPDLSDLTIIGDPTTGISKKITLSQMASLFTGTVEEYANFAAFPLVGVADTIYIALDTNVIYRYDTSLSAYVILSPNIINSLVFSDANGFDGTITLVGSVATLSITTALTLGSVPFIGASGALIQDNSNLFFDDTNNRLGIATASPTTPLDVFGSGIIGRLNATSTNNAYLGFASNGTNKWSVGNVQSDHRFRIFSEANSAELITILQTGEFGIGISNPTTKFHIDGGATALIANLDANVSVAKSVSFRSDNSSRINLEVSGTESGSNAGADFFLRTFTDAGSLIETPFTIVRSTGVTTIKSLTLTNVLSVANGGTGSATQNFVDLTTTQSVGGAKTLTSALAGTSASFSSTATATAFIPSGATVPTNGMYLSGANTLNFATNTTERIRIYSDGEIGIKGAAATEAAFALFTNDANTGFFNIFAGGSGTATKGIKLKVTSGSSTIDAMTITSGGNVGIGEISPSSILNIKSGVANDALSPESQVTITNSTSGYFSTLGFRTTDTDGTHGRAGITVTKDSGSVSGKMNFVVRKDSGVFSNAMIITSGSNFYFNTEYSGYRFIIGGSTGIRNAIFTNGDNEGYAGASTSLYIAKNTGTGRSINAAGTINASGADYAEYMKKSNIDLNFIKGDIIGIDKNGLLTDSFSDSISFVVKSTNPSYVGGDNWFNDEIAPEKTEEQTEEEFNLIFAEWDKKYQEARKWIDRIAFSGQVPCNIYNAKEGDYIIPINKNGKISGQSITNPTFEQYQISVGKVWKIMDDGRAWIAVKIG